MAKPQLYWKVHTNSLLKEIVSNLGRKDYTSLHIPIEQFVYLLIDVADRAAQLEDPELDALMCRLQLYEESDIENESYNGKLTSKVINKGMKLRQLRKKKM
jgi:hypothetical protein